MATDISSADFEPTPRRKAITANRGASLNRQSVVAKLQRERKKATSAAVVEFILGFTEWLNGQTIRASRRKGGLGK